MKYSEEELKAIEKFDKRYKEKARIVSEAKANNCMSDFKNQLNEEVNNWNIIKNLISKQQKEIETLTADLREMTISNEHKKQEWIPKSCLNSYVSKDKIREKIEEILRINRHKKKKDSEVEYAIDILKELEEE